MEHIELQKILADIDCSSSRNTLLSRWLKSEKIDFCIIDGVLTVPDTETEHIQELVYNYGSIANDYNERCRSYNIETTYSDLYHFKRGLPREIVRKSTSTTHPIFAPQKDLYHVKDRLLLTACIDRWCALKQAAIPSDTDGYLSLLDASTALHVAPDVLVDWLREYHSAPHFIFLATGQMLVDCQFVLKTQNKQDKSNPIEALILRVIEGRNVSKKFAVKLKQHIIEKLVDDSNWAVKPSDMPGATNFSLYDADEELALDNRIGAILDDYPMLPLTILSDVTGLKAPELAALAKEGNIKGEMSDGRWLISQNEFARITQFCAYHVTLDELVARAQAECGNTNFSVTKKAHREGLLEWMNDSDIGEELIEGSGLPMASGRIGYFVPEDIRNEASRAISLFIACYRASYEDTRIAILNEMRKNYPKTVFLLNSFFMAHEELKNTRAACNMLLIILKQLDTCGKELCRELGDDLIEKYFVSAFAVAAINCATIFSDFIFEAGITTKKIKFNTTGYKQEKSAYTRDHYAIMVAAIVNKEFWAEHQLVEKAIKIPKFAGLWLYVALHIIAAWRTTDYVKIPTPTLQYGDQLTLEKIATGTYSSVDAISVTEKFIDRINHLQPRPNKTKGIKGPISPLYIYCPESYKEQVGIILSIAAAQSKLYNCDESFVSPKSNTAANIHKFFGREFLQACDNRKFNGRRANKALMQAVELMATENGYSPYVAFALTSEMRSHKQSLYDPLSRTTAVYLEDGKFSGFSEAFVVEQMFQRGIMSFIVSNLLTMAYGEQYRALPIAQQTNIIANLGVDVLQIDNIIHEAQRAEEAAVKTVREILAMSKKGPPEILAAIACGNDDTKDLRSHCVCQAANIDCLCPDRRQCLGCTYEIKSKDVLLYYVINFDRQHKTLTDTTKTDQERKKAKWLLDSVLTPGLAEITTCLKATTTKEEFEVYTRIIQERTKQYHELFISNSC